MGFSGANGSKETSPGMGKKKTGCQLLVRAEDIHLPQGVMKLGSGSKDQGKEGQALAEQNQTLHHDPS